MGRNRYVKWFLLVGLCVLLNGTGVLAYDLMGSMDSPETEQETTSENPAEGEASTDGKTQAAEGKTPGRTRKPR